MSKSELQHETKPKNETGHWQDSFVRYYTARCPIIESEKNKKHMFRILQALASKPLAYKAKQE